MRLISWRVKGDGDDDDDEENALSRVGKIAGAGAGLRGFRASVPAKSPSRKLSGRGVLTAGAPATNNLELMIGGMDEQLNNIWISHSSTS